MICELFVSNFIIAGFRCIQGNSTLVYVSPAPVLVRALYVSTAVFVDYGIDAAKLYLYLAFEILNRRRLLAKQYTNIRSGHLRFLTTGRNLRLDRLSLGYEVGHAWPDVVLQTTDHA